VGESEMGGGPTSLPRFWRRTGRDSGEGCSGVTATAAAEALVAAVAFATLVLAAKSMSILRFEGVAAKDGDDSSVSEDDDRDGVREAAEAETAAEDTDASEATSTSAAASNDVEATIEKAIAIASGQGEEEEGANDDILTR